MSSRDRGPSPEPLPGGRPQAGGGPFVVGDRVQLTDPKGRPHSVTLAAGGQYFTHKGSIDHDLLIGLAEGSVVTTSGGVDHVALRPLLEDFVLAMPRGAAVVYPKDAAQVVAFADVFPGATVLEAGAGSGALSCFLLRAVGDGGRVLSVERRADFAAVAARNVAAFFGAAHPAWELVVGDLVETIGSGSTGPVDRVVLDMLAPWECVDAVGTVLRPGGVVLAYVATTTQLSQVVEALRSHGGFTEPRPWESTLRTWHVEGLAVRPDHRMIGHTGFLVTARRLAPGVTAPERRRRPVSKASADAARHDAAAPAVEDPAVEDPAVDPAPDTAEVTGAEAQVAGPGDDPAG